jgi:multiple sugar transport system permease protein
VFYTGVATSGNSALALAALLMNQHMPFKSIIRAIILCPGSCPPVLSAIAFWWIYDPQFSIISYVFVQSWAGAKPTSTSSAPNGRPASRSSPPTSGAASPSWRSRCLAGLQTISPSLYEAALLDGATPWQRFRFITFPMLLPILAIVMTFSIIFTFTDFQLVYAITRGGPGELDAPAGDAALSSAASRRPARRGRGHRHHHAALPRGGDAVQLFRPRPAQVAARGIH